jgi:hypothetical protein
MSCKPVPLAPCGRGQGPVPLAPCGRGENLVPLSPCGRGVRGEGFARRVPCPRLCVGMFRPGLARRFLPLTPDPSPAKGRGEKSVMEAA